MVPSWTRACAALASLIVASTIANAAAAVTYDSKTQLNDSTDDFKISVFSNKTRSMTSPVLGSVSTPFIDGSDSRRKNHVGNEDSSQDGNLLSIGWMLLF